MSDTPAKWWWEGFSENFNDAELDWLRGFAEREERVKEFVLPYMVERGWAPRSVYDPPAPLPDYNCPLS